MHRALQRVYQIMNLSGDCRRPVQGQKIAPHHQDHAGNS
jgi:hypothetical protein